LPYFDGRRFAVVLTNGGYHLALRGIARYVEGDEGSVLRIEVADETQPDQGQQVFVIREETWDGRFVPDHEYGCEFQLRLDADAVQNQA
jgi:hypothetical protein